MTALIVLAVAVLLVVSSLTYNGMMRRRDQVDSAWRQIDLELKRRHDLIPDLVETVRSCAAYEGGTLRRSPRRGGGRSTLGDRRTRQRPRGRSPAR